MEAADLEVALHDTANMQTLHRLRWNSMKGVLVDRS